MSKIGNIRGLKVRRRGLQVALPPPLLPEPCRRGQTLQYFSRFSAFCRPQAYIQDIRNCSTKEAERERVDKELGKIRKKYTSDKAMTGGCCRGCWGWARVWWVCCVRALACSAGRPAGCSSALRRSSTLRAVTHPLPLLLPPPPRSVRQAQVHVEAAVHAAAGLRRGLWGEERERPDRGARVRQKALG